MLTICSYTYTPKNVIKFQCNVQTTNVIQNCIYKYQTAPNTDPPLRRLAAAAAATAVALSSLVSIPFLAVGFDSASLNSFSLGPTIVFDSELRTGYIAKKRFSHTVRSPLFVLMRSHVPGEVVAFSEVFATHGALQSVERPLLVVATEIFNVTYIVIDLQSND